MKRLVFIFLLLLLTPLAAAPVQIAHVIFSASATASGDFEYVITSLTTRQELHDIVSKVKAHGLEMKVTNKKYKDGKLRVVAFKVSAPMKSVSYATTYLSDNDRICIRYSGGKLYAGKCN